MPNKVKQKTRKEKKTNAELHRAIRIQKHLQTMQKSLEQEYSRLDTEFLQLASLVEKEPQILISDSTPVVFEDEETINKKEIVLPQLLPIVTTSTPVLFPEEKEDEDF